MWSGVACPRRCASGSRRGEEWIRGGRRGVVERERDVERCGSAASASPMCGAQGAPRCTEGEARAAGVLSLKNCSDCPLTQWIHGTTDDQIRSISVRWAVPVQRYAGNARTWRCVLEAARKLVGWYGHPSSRSHLSLRERERDRWLLSFDRARSRRPEHGRLPALSTHSLPISGTPVTSSSNTGVSTQLSASPSISVDPSDPLRTWSTPSTQHSQH